MKDGGKRAELRGRRGGMPAPEVAIVPDPDAPESMRRDLAALARLLRWRSLRKGRNGSGKA